MKVKSKIESSPGSNHESNHESNHIRMSLRIDGKVTSITLKKKIIALWLIYNVGINESNIEEKISSLKTSVFDFVYECLKGWHYLSGKGLSDFITNKMISEILEKEDYAVFLNIIKNI